MDDNPIGISVRNLSKKYNSFANAPFALADLSLDVPVGKIWCLLGPNGSGKTTLLKILAGLLHPSEGSISIMGVDITKNPMEAKKQIGWMPAEERSGFYGRLSARENLEFFGALQNLPKKELTRLIGNLGFLLDFDEEVDWMFLKTSAGARQKFGLARALIHNPGVLLLDEPLRNLDPHTVLRFRRLLRDHLARKNKISILMSTHQLDEARRVADHILILNEGKILRSISQKELEAELRHKSIEDFYIKTVDSSVKSK